MTHLPLPALVDEPAPDWQRRAACRDTDRPDDWYAPGRPPDHVLNTCAGCEVRSSCLVASFESLLGNFGVWGGTTEEERGVLRRRLNLPVLTRRAIPTHAGIPDDGGEHGKRSGYLRHWRRGEEACQPCLDAHNAYTRQAPSAGKRGKRLPRSEIIVQREAG